MLTRQRQPCLRHFRSFSALLYPLWLWQYLLPLPVPSPSPFAAFALLSTVALACPFSGVSCLFSNFNANNFVFFRPCGKSPSSLPASLLLLLASCCYPPRATFLPGTATQQQPPVTKGVSYVIIRATSSCWCYATLPFSLSLSLRSALFFFPFCLLCFAVFIY